MQHHEAVAGRAVDRYLLGEMSEAEQTEFEEHYFGCPACASDVEAGAILAANAAAVFSDEGPGEATRRAMGLWAGWKWAAVAFAGIAVLAIAFEEMVRIPAVRTNIAAISAPQPYPVFFLRSVVRGNDQPVTTARGAAFIGLSFDLPPGVTAPRYAGRLESDSGRVVWTVSIPPPPSPADPVNVLVPAESFPAGRYTLVVGRHEPSGSLVEVSRYPFVLEYR